MKRFLTIGDLHGNNAWKEFEDIKLLINDFTSYPLYDHYIFLGDYVDDFHRTNDEIYNNLKDIINFKKKYPNNVILLLGNHDIQYYLVNPLINKNNKYLCSGYRIELHFDLFELFNNNKDLFQISFQYKNYIWTHAGIHKGWYSIFEKDFNKLKEHYNIDNDINLSDKLNIAFDYRLDCLFYVDKNRGGKKNEGGPFWLDKELLYKKPLLNYNQIVGHNLVNNIKTYKKNDKTSLTFVDVLNYKNDFYILEIN